MEAKRDDKEKGSVSSTRSRNVKCFKCQGFGHYANECTNKKIMIVLDNGDVVSEDEKCEQESDEEDVDYPVQGEMLILRKPFNRQPRVEGRCEQETMDQLDRSVQDEILVTRRTLNGQPKAKEDEQRENFFHTRCLVRDKVCNLIIDGRSCTNVASEELVNKLGLEVYKHPKPYVLQWLNEEGEMKVSRQMKVLLTVGRYQDEITLPLEASNILLGRPWKYDKRAVHDGFTNRHIFTHREKKITLVPLTPQEVQQDQMHLKKRSEEAKASAKALLLDEVNKVSN